MRVTASYFYEWLVAKVYYSATWFNILSDHRPPGALQFEYQQIFLTLSNQYRSPDQDSYLRPKRLSQLEFEIWQLRPLRHPTRS